MPKTDRIRKIEPGAVSTGWCVCASGSACRSGRWRQRLGCRLGPIERGTPRASQMATLSRNCGALRVRGDGEFHGCDTCEFCMRGQSCAISARRSSWSSGHARRSVAISAADRAVRNANRRPRASAYPSPPSRQGSPRVITGFHNRLRVPSSAVYGTLRAVISTQSGGKPRAARATPIAVFWDTVSLARPSIRQLRNLRAPTSPIGRPGSWRTNSARRSY